MTHIRIIGDIHGKARDYFAIIKEVQYTIQLGDMALDYKFMSSVDPVKHRIIMGNHDNYDNPPPHSLGDSGLHAIPLKDGEFKFFFVRGAFSVDKWRRIEGSSWWRNEELNHTQSNACIDLWAETKPAIVLSHDCPKFLLSQVGHADFAHLEPSHTNRLLESLFSIHQPKLWIFGHHHRNMLLRAGNTLFVALSGTGAYGRKAGYVDFDENGKMSEIKE
jgi:predicted phosphodiesterase